MVAIVGAIQAPLVAVATVGAEFKETTYAEFKETTYYEDYQNRTSRNHP